MTGRGDATRVLLTGVGGFLGGSIARRLQATGHEVLGVGRHSAGAGVDCAEMELPGAAFEDLAESWAPQVLVHAAGPASVGASLDRPGDDFRGSVGVTAALLETVRRRLPDCRVVLLSSAAVYGNPSSLPIAENAPRRPISPYGYHKAMCESLAEEYATVYGLATCCLRIFSAYGPGLRRQVVFEAFDRLRRTGRLELQGTGAESRDFVHVDDVAAAVGVVVRRPPPAGAAVNVATGRETTISEVAAMIRDRVSPSTEVRFTGAARPGDPLRWRADVSALTALGYQPGLTFEQGLSATLEAWLTRAEENPT